jgi:hypothetical protein
VGSRDAISDPQGLRLQHDHQLCPEYFRRRTLRALAAVSGSAEEVVEICGGATVSARGEQILSFGGFDYE